MNNKVFKYWAAVILKDKADKILFLKKKSSWLWTIPWWKVESWEDFLTWALRELKEEAWIEKITLDFFSHSISFSKWIYWKEATFIWVMEEHHKVKVTEKDIFSDIVYFHIDEIDSYDDFEPYDYIILDMLKWKKDRYLSFDEIEI